MALRYAVVLAGLVGMGCSNDLLKYRTRMWHECEGRYNQALERTKHLKAKLADRERAIQKLRGREEACQRRTAEAEQRLAELRAKLAEREALARKLEEQKQKMAERAALMRRLLARLKSMVEAGNLQVRIRKGRMILNLPNQILFPPGRATLRKEGKDALTKLAEILKEIRDRDLVVAGHTDSQPIRHSRYKSNWELSVARALAVVEFLQEQGVDPRRLSAAGFSMYDPVAENDTPEGRAQNRRIEIIVMPKIEELPDWGVAPDEASAQGPQGSASGRTPPARPSGDTGGQTPSPRSAGGQDSRGAPPARSAGGPRPGT